MDIKIEIIKEEKRKKLEKLLQLYLHDLSNSFPIDFDSDKCEYNYDLLSYFRENKAYFIKEEDNILGFVLVDINDNNTYEISEIFILNNYKGKQIGAKAVQMIFDLYKGNWIVKVVPNSILAEKFWNKVILEYTNDNYQLNHTGKYNRAEFYFNNI